MTFPVSDDTVRKKSTTNQSGPLTVIKIGTRKHLVQSRTVPVNLHRSFQDICTASVDVIHARDFTEACFPMPSPAAPQRLVKVYFLPPLWERVTQEAQDTALDASDYTYADRGSFLAVSEHAPELLDRYGCLVASGPGWVDACGVQRVASLCRIDGKRELDLGPYRRTRLVVYESIIVERTA